jgi:hypothetical protein
MLSQLEVSQSNEGKEGFLKSETIIEKNVPQGPSQPALLFKSPRDPTVAPP